jgi:hypothetical protein
VLWGKQKFCGRLYLVLALPILLWHPASAQESEGISYRVASPEEVAGARAVAEQLLLRIDSASLSTAQATSVHGDSGVALKTRYTPSAFAARIASVRGPLGAVAERTYSGLHGPYHTLPNIIAGEYLIIVFDTRFQGRPGLHTEQVTLEADRSGAATWRLVEYYVASVPSSSDVR